MPPVPRRRLEEAPAPPARVGLYFTSDKDHLDFVRSGSTMLDNALGGGWVLGRMTNIIGNSATGKTLLAIEAAANFARDYPRGKIFFRERESAFDPGYAKAMGLPLSRVDFGPQSGPGYFDTVEGWHDDMLACIEKCRAVPAVGNKPARAATPALYILDSFDSLSVKAEMARKITDASYGGDRAKKTSELFRRLIRDMEEVNLGLIIVSQIRDKIGVLFGPKTGRMGGRALDFYATHIVELAHLKDLKRTRASVERIIGNQIKARVSKNKVSVPKRTAEFDILFGYGIDDLGSCMDWLMEVGRLDVLGITGANAANIEKNAVAYLKASNAMDDIAYRARVAEVAVATKAVWKEVEEGFLPTRTKYA